MSRPKGTGGKAKELTTKEILRIDRCLVDTRHEFRDRALFYLALGTGMRIGECAGLLIRDVFDSYDSMLDQIVLEKHSTKNNRSRTVFLSTQSQKYLKLHIDKLLNNCYDKGRPIFSSQKNPQICMRANLGVVIINKIFAAAGIVNASSHSLRRSHANALRRNGADMMLIKEQLGHGSLTVTQRYFVVDPREVAEVVGRLKF